MTTNKQGRGFYKLNSKAKVSWKIPNQTVFLTVDP